MQNRVYHASAWQRQPISYYLWTTAALFSFLFLSCHSIRLSAQSSTEGVKKIPFHRYTTESIGKNKNLNSTEISALYQDRDGYIWIGNKPGVSRFDGYEFQNFTRTDDQFLGQIYTIEEDSTETLWIGGSNGLFYYKDGGFHPAQLEKKVIRSLHLGKGKELWVGGLGFVPFSLSPSDLQKLKASQHLDITPIVSRKEWEKKIGNFRVWAIDTDNNGEVWFGLDNRHASFDGQQLHIHWIDSTVIHKYCAVAAFHRDSVFWGSEETTALLQKNGQLQNATESTTYIFTVTDSAIYFLTPSNLLALQKGQWDTLHTLTNYSHLYIQNMILDREGNFWIGAMGDLIKLTPTVFQTWSETEHPLLESNHSIAQLPDGEILIGSSHGKVLVRNDAEFKVFTQIDIPMNSVIGEIYAEKLGEIWYGTSMAGIVLDRDNQQEKYTTKEGFGDNGQYLFYKSRNGELWSGGDGGVTRITMAADGTLGFENFMAARPGIDDDFPLFQKMFESPDGILWAVSDKGLYRLTNNDLESWTFSQPITPNPIITSAIVNGQELWLGTQGEGLWQCRFNTLMKPEIVKQWKVKDGLQSDVILNVHIDKNNRIWCVSQNGICVLDPTRPQFAIQCFNESDGWLNAPTTESHLLETTDGFLWAVSNTAINAFPLYHIPKNNVPPKTFITRVELFDGKEKIHKYARNQKDTIQLPQELVLPYDKNFLRFYFTTTNHTKPQKNKFRYRLEGLDWDWSEAGYARNILYSGLQAGTYTFKVIAANNDGVWGEEDGFSFVVLPPWWKTWWAYTLYGLLFLFGLWALRRYEIKRQALRHALEMEQVKAEKLEDVNALKSRFFANISHEFRTPLTVILGMTENLKTKSKEEQLESFVQPLQMIDRNGQHLLHLVNEMLDLAKIDSGDLALKLQQADVIPFIKYVTESFHSLAAEKHINLVAQAAEQTLIMDFDADKLAAIVSNLLSNAIKFTPEGGDVAIRLATKAAYFSISVKDNGMGIANEDIPHIFDRFYQADHAAVRRHPGTGIGLALTKELVALMKGTILLESEPGKGSEFIVRLPIHREALLAESPAFVTSLSPGISPSAPYLEEDSSHDEVGLPLVLIIEDHVDVAQYIGTCLHGKYQYVHVANGKLGIETALEKIPDLIICDVMMPEKNGFEVCATLKADERTNHIPIIMLTARVTIGDRLAGLARGADAYLAKPFEKEELLIRLHQLFELRKTLQKKYSEQLFIDLPTDTILVEEDSFLARARAIVMAELEDDEFSLNELSEKLYLSRSQVHRKIKAVTGMSTAIFIRTIRLQEAKKLLTSTHLTISEIAYQVGFKSPVYFSQMFKETFGESPTENRK